MTKQRRKYQSTSAAGVSQYLHRQGLKPLACRSDVLGQRWVVIVNCVDLAQTNSVWVALRQGGYSLVGQFHTWIVLNEKEADGQS